MEICLFVVLSVSGAALHLRERRAMAPRRPSLALVVLGLASLARPEGLLLLALAVADRLLLPAAGTRRRDALPGLALGALCAVALIAAVQLFSFTVSESLLPTTYAVKTDGPRALLPSGIYLLRVLGVLFRAHPLPVLLAAAGTLTLVERLGTPRDRGLLPALWLAGLPLAYSLYDSPDAPMMVGNFGRYHFPLFPFVLVIAALALERPIERLRAAPRATRVAGALVLASLVMVPPLSSLRSGSERYALNVRNVNESDVAIANWVREHLPPEAVIAAQDVGAVGFFAPNPLIDLTGIVTPEILPAIEGSAGTPGGRAGLLGYLTAQRPDYLMLFADSYPGLLESLDAEVVQRVRLERNVTMAGSDLVLARPLWDRGADGVR
jgi:arabinofuranosyltransferase